VEAKKTGLGPAFLLRPGEVHYFGNRNVVVICFRHKVDLVGPDPVDAIPDRGDENDEM
jgi:hypothetical protein